MKVRQFPVLALLIAVICLCTSCTWEVKQNGNSPSSKISSVSDEVSLPQPAQMTVQSKTEENGVKHITVSVKQNNVTASEIVDTFVIDILTPNGYDSTKKYPVLYITDGNWRREDYKDIQSLSAEGSIVDLILVGICYPDSYDVNTIRKKDFIFQPEMFLSFVVNNVIPYVNENYSTDTTNQTLWGASYGGYFALYSLLQSAGVTKDVFHNYIFASPTFTVEPSGKLMLDYEEDLYAQTKKLDINVYMTVGGMESPESFLIPFQSFEKQLKSRNYEGLNFTSKIYDGKDHFTVWKPTLIDGLKMFLAPNN